MRPLGSAARSPAATHRSDSAARSTTPPPTAPSPTPGPAPDTGAGEVALFTTEGDAATLVRRFTLNADGRSDGPLYDNSTLKTGTYRLVFDVAGYFKARGVALPERSPPHVYSDDYLPHHSLDVERTTMDNVNTAEGLGGMVKAAMATIEQMPARPASKPASLSA